MNINSHHCRVLRQCSCGLLFSATLVACQTISAAVAVPARLTAMDAAQTGVQQQVRQMVASALSVDISAVNLADDTLINSSQFVVARAPRYDSAGQLLQGRIVEPANVFKLVLRGDECWLDYQGTVQRPAKQMHLIAAKCKPE